MYSLLQHVWFTRSNRPKSKNARLAAATPHWWYEGINRTKLQLLQVLNTSIFLPVSSRSSSVPVLFPPVPHSRSTRQYQPQVVVASWPEVGNRIQVRKSEGHEIPPKYLEIGFERAMHWEVRESSTIRNDSVVSIYHTKVKFMAHFVRYRYGYRPPQLGQSPLVRIPGHATLRSLPSS